MIRRPRGSAISALSGNTFRYDPAMDVLWPYCFVARPLTRTTDSVATIASPFPASFVEAVVPPAVDELDRAFK